MSAATLDNFATQLAEALCAALTALGTLELARLICEVDRVFFAEAFPELAFSRGDSWENTMAYGKPACELMLVLCKI
jgi:hypothetical protein